MRNKPTSESTRESLLSDNLTVKDYTKYKYYKFFRNRKCEFFPCHKTNDEKKFNCLMCYCPLYYIESCGGNFIVMKNGVKDCTNCLLPHYNYELVVEKITKRNLEG